MTVEEIAIQVIEACETEGVAHMVTGAFAFNYYGIPRSTKDVDLVVDVSPPGKIETVIKRLSSSIEFNAQVQFDTLTWGRRHIGRPKGETSLQVELFELFDDPFVKTQFQRRVQLPLPQLRVHTWIPTAEDVIVQKLRWGRAKDLEDVRDILAVQGIETLDLPYIRQWTDAHRTTERLDSIVANLPEF